MQVGGCHGCPIATASMNTKFSFVFTAIAILLLPIASALHPSLHDVSQLPSAVDGSIPRLSGLIDDVASLKQKPRAVIGYISDQNWAFQEFLCMTQASWRYITDLAGPRFKLDLLVFAHPRWSKEVSTICEGVDLQSTTPGTSFDHLFDWTKSQCFAILYPPPAEHIWHSYPFINNVHFLADPRVKQLLLGHYGYVMKTDFDTFLSPMFLHFWPDRFTFGVQEYVVVQSTSDRLAAVSHKLGLRHAGRHNLGPTWYGDVATLLALAELSIPIMYHIVTQEFEQTLGGGVAQMWQQGEGWPDWSAGIAALYATELAANHFIQHFDTTNKFDAHADSELSLVVVYHLHCRHGDGHFSKFEFFQHHYDHVDLSTLNVALVRGYATFLAASTWRTVTGRHNQQLTQAGQPQVAQMHTEL